MSTLITMASLGQGAEIAGDDQLARAIEEVVFMICDRRYGPDFWEEHSVECLGSNADPVECWENLIQKLAPAELDYHEGQRMGEPARTYKGAKIMTSMESDDFKPFSIEGQIDDHVFMGLNTGENWNGWAVPYVHRDEMLKIVEYASGDENDLEFMKELEDLKNSDPVLLSNGMSLYPINLGWCWDWVDQ